MRRRMTHGTQGLASALQVIQNLPSNILYQNPAGSWSFVGSVDVRLKYARKDGQPMTDEEYRKIANFGFGLFTSTHRTLTWPTEADGIAAGAALGVIVRGQDGKILHDPTTEPTAEEIEERRLYDNDPRHDDTPGVD